MTKAQRHKYYKKALGIVRTKGVKDCAVCLILDEFFDGHTWLILPTMFPEWYQYKPEKEKSYDGWWPYTKKGKESRIAALKQCIKLTTPKPLPHAKR